MKNFRSFLKDKKAVKYFAIGLATGIMLTAVLLSSLKIGVEIYKAYMRSYYAEASPSQSDVSNNSIGKSDAEYSFYGWGCYVTLPTEYLPFECSKNDDIYFNYAAYKFFWDKPLDEENRFIYLDSDYASMLPLFETDRQLSISGYIAGALYLQSSDCLYRIVVDERGDIDFNSFSVVIDKKAAPVFIEENKMYLKVDGEQDDYYVLLDTLTGKYEQVYDCNENINEVPNDFISKSEAEKIALSAINDNNRFPELADENIVLFCSVEDGNLYGNPEYYDTHLIHRPDFAGYSDIFYEPLPEYCWKVELVADIPDWWMPRATLYINAETGAVSYAKTFLPD